MPELPAIRTGAQGFFPIPRAYNLRPPKPQFYRFVGLPAVSPWLDLQLFVLFATLRPTFTATDTLAPRFCRFSGHSRRGPEPLGTSQARTQPTTVLFCTHGKGVEIRGFGLPFNTRPLQRQRSRRGLT